MAVGKHANPSYGWHIDHTLGIFASRLSMIVGIGCVLSCGYVLMLLVTSYPCWAFSSASCRITSCPGTNSAVPQALGSALFNGADRDNRSVHLTMREKHTFDLDVPRPTSLDRIVFGIGASADLWSRRKEYLKVWWTPNRVRGFVWADRSFGKNWTTTDPPYKVSADTSKFKYTHKKGRRSAIRISRIVSETFRLGLPDVDWFVMGDDDTFFFTDNLVKVLSKYDHRKFYYIGSSSEDHIQNQQFSYNMAYGGGGFAISYPLAKLLSETQDDCLERYPQLFGSDDRMHACMIELGVPLTKEIGFHQFDIYGDAFGILSAHPLVPIVSIHHLDAIYPIFPNTTRVGGLELLMKAISANPNSIFQQSICYDKDKQWSFAVSWGYVVQVFRGFLPPMELELPTLTFLSWHRRREPYAFHFNSRYNPRGICEEPTMFFMGDASATMSNSSSSVYYRSERANRQRLCHKGLYPISNIQLIRIESEPLDESFLKSPRRPCCRVTGSSPQTLDMHVGTCRDGETLVG